MCEEKIQDRKSFHRTKDAFGLFEEGTTHIEHIDLLL
jgi:hypothetical protein